MLGLFRFDTNCTLKLWERVISQETLTLNMIFMFSLHYQLFGQFYIAQ